MLHALRHLYASERTTEGMDIATLAERLGHSDPAYTLRNYVHQVTDDHEEERRRIDRTLRGSTVRRSIADVG
jgi:integrase